MNEIKNNKNYVISDEERREFENTTSENIIHNSWDEIFGNLNIENLSDINPYELDIDLDEASPSLIKGIKQWYSFIEGPTKKGSRNLKHIIKHRLINLFPQIENQISTIRISIEENIDIQDKSINTLLFVSINITITIKKNNLISPHYLNENVEKLSGLKELLRVQDINIYFKTRDPKERFMELKKTRLHKIRSAFKMIERLNNEKYYNFEGKSKELISIKNEIFVYLRLWIS